MAEQEQHDQAVAEKALYNYLQAVKIDPTDYSLWYHIGYLSQRLHKLRFARFAYETGFYTSEQERTLKIPTVRPNDAIRILNGGKFTVMQWRCLENLCQVLYDIGDYRLCTFYVDLALKRNAHWETGLQLKQQLSESNEMQLSERDTWSTEAMETDETDKNPIAIHLERSDWTLLIKSLLDEHKRLVYKDAASSNSSKRATDTNDTEAEQSKEDFYISHAIVIHVDDKEEKDEEKDETEQVVHDSSEQASEAAVAIPEPVIVLEKPVDQEQSPKEPIVLVEKPISKESDSASAMDVDSIREPVVLVEKSDDSLVQDPSVMKNAGSGEPVNQTAILEQSVASNQSKTDPQEGPSRPKPFNISDLLSQSSSAPIPLLNLVPSPTTTEPIVIESTPDISSDVEMSDASHVVPYKRKRDHDGDDESASQTDTDLEKSTECNENDGEGEDDEEEEEEDEAEEKRLSLR